MGFSTGRCGREEGIDNGGELCEKRSEGGGGPVECRVRAETGCLSFAPGRGGMK